MSLAHVNRHGSPYLRKPRSDGWTKDEDTFLRENYAKMRAIDIGDHLGRTALGVRSRVQKLGGFPFPEKTP